MALICCTYFVSDNNNNIFLFRALYIPLTKTWAEKHPVKKNFLTL